MALFFFHLITANGRQNDPFGLDLPSVEAAYLQAAAAAPEVAAELMRAGENTAYCSFEIVNEYNETLLRFEFDEVTGRQASAAPCDTPTSRLVKAIEVTHRDVTLAQAAFYRSLDSTRETIRQSREIILTMQKLC